MCIVMARSEDRDRKKRLNKMMTELQKIDPAEIIIYLTCLSDMRKEQIRASLKNNGRMVAAAELFEELPKRENWYSILVHALRAMELETLADKLEGPEKQPDPSGPSQSAAMSGLSSHSAQVNQSQGKQLYQSPPACDPCPPASQQRRPEAEASITPGYPIKGQQKDASLKGEEKDDNKQGHGVNPGQSASGSSLPMPVQERRQEASASDPTPRDSESSGGSTASSPSSDESGISPRLEGRPTPMEREPVGEAEEPAGRTLPSNSSPTAGAVEVSVRPKVDMLTRREAAPGRMEEDEEKQRDKERRELRRVEENWNIQNVSSNAKNLPNLQKPKNYPNDNVNLNNLSPTKDVGEFNWDRGKANNLEARNVEGLDDECMSAGTHTLSSHDVDPAQARLLSEMSESDILEGISEEPTATSGGSHLQQIDRGSALSIGEGGAYSLIATMGSVVRAVVEHVLTKPS